MDTKKKILDVALTLFSEKGYGNVYVGQIAEGVGIKAPSLYKHYKSKQDIFNAILDEMRERYNQKVADLNMNGNDILIDLEVYKNASEDDLVKMGTGLFSFFLHDEYECKFRKMLTLEQFSDKELAGLFSNQYFDEPLKYQSGMLQFLIMQGKLKGDDADVMALQFFAPIYLLMTVCDRQPEREKECLRKLEKHIRQFSRIYKGEEK
jgi:AcrR family transcriptional regulator